MWCMSSCNIVQGDEHYIGPAPIVKGYRFYMDEREGEDACQRRLDVLSQLHGVWRCQTRFSRTVVCPKDIPITEQKMEHFLVGFLGFGGCAARFLIA